MYTEFWKSWVIKPILVILKYTISKVSNSWVFAFFAFFHAFARFLQFYTEICQKYYVIACESVPEFVKLVPKLTKFVRQFDKIYIDLHKLDILVPEFVKLT